jgi:hypothetical protein
MFLSSSFPQYGSLEMRFANDVSASSYTQTGRKKASSQRNIQQVMIFTRKDKSFFADFIENARSPFYQCLLFVALVALVALVTHVTDVTDVIFFQDKR